MPSSDRMTENEREGEGDLSWRQRKNTSRGNNAGGLPFPEHAFFLPTVGVLVCQDSAVGKIYSKLAMLKLAGRLPMAILCTAIFVKTSRYVFCPPPSGPLRLNSEMSWIACNEKFQRWLFLRRSLVVPRPITQDKKKPLGKDLKPHKNRLQVQPRQIRTSSIHCITYFLLTLYRLPGSAQYTICSVRCVKDWEKESKKLSNLIQPGRVVQCNYKSLKSYLLYLARGLKGWNSYILLNIYTVVAPQWDLNVNERDIHLNLSSLAESLEKTILKQLSLL